MTTIGRPMGGFERRASSADIKQYHVYILANRSRTLYTGVTNDLELRVHQHKAGAGCGFTRKYQITRLVFYEAFSDIRQAIAWEKRIKGWTRAKKIALIEERNPYWRDFAADWSQADAIAVSVRPQASYASRSDARTTADRSPRTG